MAIDQTSYEFRGPEYPVYDRARELMDKNAMHPMKNALLAARLEQENRELRTELRSESAGRG